MEQRLRLVQGGQPRKDKRANERRPVQVPGQIVWKDAGGTTRFAAVMTRDVSDYGVSVECLNGTPIPKYRLCYFQVDRTQRDRKDLPSALQKSHVLSAVYRVEACSSATGLPNGYALRLLVEPDRRSAAGTLTSGASRLTAEHSMSA